MLYESHPELAVEGSFTHERMRAEVERLGGMMQTVWERVTKSWMPKPNESVEVLTEAKQWY